MGLQAFEQSTQLHGTDDFCQCINNSFIHNRYSMIINYCHTSSYWKRTSYASWQGFVGILNGPSILVFVGRSSALKVYFIINGTKSFIVLFPMKSNHLKIK